MDEEFSNLGWPEATISDMSLGGGRLIFKMHDILAYSDPLKYEVVEIEIYGIHTLRLELSAYKDGKYGPPEVIINIGSVASDAYGFAGVAMTSPFHSSKAEYYYVNGDFEADRVLVHRTGKFVFKPRAK